MPTNTLTDAQVKRLQPREKPYKVFDGAGMFLYVTETSKIWRVAYRVNGKQQTKSLGPYPLVSLAQAREKRDELKRSLLAGDVPTRRKAVPTLSEVSARYWETRQDLSAAYLMNARNALDKYVFGRFGARPVDQLTRDDIMAVLVGMNDEGKFVYLRKLRMWLAQVLDFAVEHRWLTDNPAAGIRTDRAFGRRKVQHFAALELHEVGPFLARIAMERDLESVLANGLMARTWLRTGEIRNLRVADIGVSPGLPGRRILIPGERMKRAKDLIVPLSRQADEIVLRAILRNRGSEYVFPAVHRADRPMSENTILELIDRVGHKGRMTGHGWRTVASTWANEAGYREDAIERQLAHKPDDEVRATYNRAEYLAERATMLQAWADWLDQQTAACRRGPA